MENVVIHRRIEEHAATKGDAPAIVDRRETLTYRTLNQQANIVARQLINHGFRRGNHAIVAMAPGADLAAVLLAVMKAGGSYAWRQVPDGIRPQLVFAARPAVPAHATVDLVQMLGSSCHPGPNLPVLVRGWDIACVLGDAAQTILVPHATIATLTPPASASSIAWSGDPGAFDLWSALLAGATVAIHAPVGCEAAAA